jgi:hypothetical protein
MEQVDPVKSTDKCHDLRAPPPVTNFEFRRKKGKQNSFRFETGFEVNNLFL